jgi:hypothetical protein
MKTVTTGSLSVSSTSSQIRKLMLTAFLAATCISSWGGDASAQWVPQQQIPNVASSNSPGLAHFDNRIYAAWKGANTDQTMFWSSFDGVGWTPQQQIPTVASSVGPSLAGAGNLLFAAWKGANPNYAPAVNFE